MAQIRRAAEEMVQSKREVITILPARVLAYAAIFMLFLGGGYFYLSWEASPAGTGEAGIDRVGTVVTMVSPEDASFSEEYGRSIDTTDRRALARQLLELEGMSVDDFDDGDEIMFLEEIYPDNLQSRAPGITAVDVA